MHTPFVQSICQEIRLYAAEYAEREPIDTIYFGGGTPSRLLPDEVESILGVIHDNFDTSGVVETTFEVNPEDCTLEYLKAIRNLGIDRLSLGVQSFFESDLKFMGRAHDAGQARSSVDAISRAGFDRLSIDLIFGIPGQPEEYWPANLERAREMQIPHISTYSLTIEERTPLWKQVQLGRVQPVDDEVHTARFRFAMDYLREADYEHYEISSFAADGHRSVHNHRYWSHTNYLGFGPSAHSFWWLGLPARRWSNLRNLNQYEAFLSGQSRPIDGQEALSLDALAREYVMLRLRTSDGIVLDTLDERYGYDLLTEKIDDLAYLESSGLIDPIRNQIVRLTDLGKTVCNSVTERLIPDGVD